ncbi:MAG: hypothetical protein JO034_08300 [Singulisphaera sp.]|nr:hypothetical protein [Planctomycetaceae bacterium]MBV8607445.1 hypothetical protein [Singulisphaera sp.]
MSRLHRVATALLFSGALSSIATAQSPSPSPSDLAPGEDRVSPEPTAPAPVPARVPLRRRSIVHHYPYPYPGYYQDDESAGFRNPGGVGRYAEYYPPGDQFQVEQDPVKVATFGQGGGPNWDEQRAAQQLGVQKYQAIQQHIDNYARPYFGYGFGAGFFGGFY